MPTATVTAMQDQIDTLTTRINLADDRLQAFRAYLASPRFVSPSGIPGAVPLDDIERHLGEIWRELHGIN